MRIALPPPRWRRGPPHADDLAQGRDEGSPHVRVSVVRSVHTQRAPQSAGQPARCSRLPRTSRQSSSRRLTSTDRDAPSCSRLLPFRFDRDLRPSVHLRLVRLRHSTLTFSMPYILSTSVLSVLLSKAWWPPSTAPTSVDVPPPAAEVPAGAAAGGVSLLPSLAQRSIVLLARRRRKKTGRRGRGGEGARGKGTEERKARTRGRLAGERRWRAERETRGQTDARSQRTRPVVKAANSAWSAWRPPPE